MKTLAVPSICWALAAATALFAQDAPPAAPKAGPVTIMKASEVKAGMTGYAWTVFNGTEPEAVPIEILGLLKNAWGPKQDIILGKMGGRAQRTNVAGGMSGSPVYVDGKLVGAVSTRISVFSPDAICGITPIELMLELKDFDTSRPADGRTPGAPTRAATVQVPNGPLAVAGGAMLTPIATPLVLSGFSEAAIDLTAPLFTQAGFSLAQGGASSALSSAKPAPGWEKALQPGQAVSGVLVSGDMSMTAMGTVTYNDGKKVLAFGHSFLNLGPVGLPMARTEVLMTLASSYQPNKYGNAIEVVGAVKQDRHSGVLGVLGEETPMIPTHVKVRSFDENDRVVTEKDLNFQVFVNDRWTPALMMTTLYNAISGLNDFAEEATYRISGRVDVEGHDSIALANMFAPSDLQMQPVPILMASWWADKFNRLYTNNLQTPMLKGVDVTVDLLPQRRSATIQNAWAETSEVEAGGEVPVRVFLQPFRGGVIERSVTVKIPAGFPKGNHRILISDADTLNRMQTIARSMNRFMDLPQTVSLINQERTNNNLYISLVQARPTVYRDDKTLPSLPGSVANVMQNGRTGNRTFFTAPETAIEQEAIPFDVLVNGSYSLSIKVD